MDFIRPVVVTDGELPVPLALMDVRICNVRVIRGRHAGKQGECWPWVKDMHKKM